MALPIYESSRLDPADETATAQASNHLHLLNGGDFNIDPQNRIEDGEAYVDGARVSYTVEFSQNPLTNTAVLIGPGKGGVESMYASTRTAFANLGLTAISMEPPHRQTDMQGFLPRHLFRPHRLLPLSFGAVMKDVQQFEIPDLYLLGHSMGGPAAVTAAKKNPELTRAIILPAPAGVEEHSFWDLFSRLPNHIPNEILPYLLSLSWKDLGKLAVDETVHTFINPLRSVTETVAVSRSRLLPRMAALTIPNVIIVFPNDRLLRIEKAREALVNYEGEHVEYPDPEAGHLLPQMKPDAFANYVIELLKTMDPKLREQAVSTAT